MNLWGDDVDRAIVTQCERSQDRESYRWYY